MNMRADTQQRAEALAGFLAGQRAMQVNRIAHLDGCPIRPPQEAEFLGMLAECSPEDRPLFRWTGAVVGAEEHCQRVTAALNAAVKLGLIEKTRFGKGPWLYRALNGAS